MVRGNALGAALPLFGWETRARRGQRLPPLCALAPAGCCWRPLQAHAYTPAAALTSAPPPPGAEFMAPEFIREFHPGLRPEGLPTVPCVPLMFLLDK